MRALHIATVTLFCFLLLFAGIVSAEKQRIISDINEYGGKTIEVTREDGDKRFDEILKIIQFSDRKGTAIKREIFHTDKFAREHGHNREIDYYDDSGKLTHIEY